MMLEKTTDTTVRGVVFEAAGTVPPTCSPPASRRWSTRAAHERDPVRAAWTPIRAAIARRGSRRCTTAIDGLLAGPRRVPA